MTSSQLAESVARRSFLSRVGGSLAAFGAAWSAGAALTEAAVQSPTAPSPAAASDPHWQPTRHAQDDWLDRPSKHRLAWDTTTPAELEDAIQFANNFYSANKNVYAIENSELAVVIILRHRSAPFAFNDAIWAKYGATLARRADFTDPKTKEAPTVNFFTPTSTGDATARPRGLAGLIKAGAQFAICDLSTHGIASLIAKDAGITADAAYKELTANLIGNGRLVAAGIVAVNRVQERGYSIT
jgi:hypothetical protein